MAPWCESAEFRPQFLKKLSGSSPGSQATTYVYIYILDSVRVVFCCNPGIFFVSPKKNVNGMDDYFLLWPVSTNVSATLETLQVRDFDQGTNQGGVAISKKN